MFRENRFLVVFFALVFGGVAHAAIYKTTDANGNVVYTDSPTREAKTVDLPPLSIVPSLSPEQIAQAMGNNTQASAQAAVTRYQLNFVQPLAEQTVRKPDPIAVNVNVQPALANGDNVSILLDGVVVANGNGVTISTEKLDRGAHSIAARVTNTMGRVVSEVSTTVYVQQTTVNSPANQANRARAGK